MREKESESSLLVMAKVLNGQTYILRSSLLHTTQPKNLKGRVARHRDGYRYDEATSKYPYILSFNGYRAHG